MLSRVKCSWLPACSLSACLQMQLVPACLLLTTACMLACLPYTSCTSASCCMLHCKRSWSPAFLILQSDDQFLWGTIILPPKKSFAGYELANYSELFSSVFSSVAVVVVRTASSS